jgi:hypothetical protein
MKTPEEIAGNLCDKWLKTTSGLRRAAIHTHISVPVLVEHIAAAIQAERDHWTSESNLPRVEEVQGAFREAKLMERIADLEKGLEPFAEIAKKLDELPITHPQRRFPWLGASAHCRRALELLKTKG